MIGRAAVGAVVVAALVIAVSVAYGAIPDSNGVISACYKESGGALRVVDEGVVCGKNEAPLSWNQQGPQGVPGLPGGALTFAYIGLDGHVDETRSRGITDSTLTVVENQYCFDLSFTFANVVATAVGQKPAPYATVLPAFIAGDGEIVPGCTGEDVVIYLWSPSGSTGVDLVSAPFYVVFN